MSISKSLLRATKLQEKIEALREQLSDLLDKARAEIAASPVEEVSVTPQRGRPKMLKSIRGKARGTTAPAAAPKKVDARTKDARTAKAGTRVRGKAKRSPLAGHKRAESPSGPLAPAVVKVLQSKKQPMNVRDILAGLLANGYHFNSAEPKKNLAARIYRLKGVKQVDAGLFGLA